MSSQSEHAVDGGSGGEGTFRTGVRFWLDVAFKLTVPVGAIVGVWLAHFFEANESVRQIANQREQSESNLRATMFGHLISPIVGPPKDGKPLDPVRYGLMVQLLALNFHEHFEFRPLIEHADELLAGSGLTEKDKIERRSALKSVAHRIIDRQIASLHEDGIRDCTPRGPAQVTFWLFSTDQEKSIIDSYRAEFGDEQVLLFNPELRKPVMVNAPNCKDTLSITFAEPKWSAGRADVNIVRSDAVQTGGAHGWFGFLGSHGAIYSESEPDVFQFTLSSFSFPFTDNTPLIDGNRFAIFIRDESSGNENGKGRFIWKVQLRWFPGRYYAVTERPVDYEVVRKAMNIVPSEGVSR